MLIRIKINSKQFKLRKGDKSVVKVKICGLKRVQDIEIVNNFRPDYIGFVFTPSERQIDLETAKKLKRLLHPSIKSVGVFVNEPPESIIKYEAEGVIDSIQLHGNEDIVYLKTLKKTSKLPIIKAFRINSGRTLEESLLGDRKLLESEIIDYVLLDSYHPVSYGGNGECFNWEILKNIYRPYFLAGGIGVDNVQEALKYRPYAIDVSSKVEKEGIKDTDKIKELMDQLRK